LDGDGYSDISTFRGYNWRGKDCDPYDKNIYPGRKTYNGKYKWVDYNCNGIFGVNPINKKLFKD